VNKSHQIKNKEREKDMKSNLRRNVVISVLTICLLVLLLTGSTYALFTDQASTSIVVGSAKVDVEVEITDVKTYSMDVLQAQGKFELGGTAEVTTEGVLALVHVAPGDKVEFTLDITNNSNITILERITFVNVTTDGVNPLLTNLVITIGSVEYKFDANGNFCRADGKAIAWNSVATGAQQDLVVTIELPTTAGNDCQEKSVTLQIILEAYQGNATTADLENPALPRE
jgi:predicted ribosomally synthesized peptide with SipW-like signal peptide